MSSSESESLYNEVQYPPSYFHDRFSFSSETRPPTPVNLNAPVNPIFEERTRIKVDRRLIPVLAVLYAIVFIDATNLDVARREGADEDFGLLKERRYYFVSFVFFLPSILLQLPLNMALVRVGTALWLGTMTFLLGALQIASGFVTVWGQFLALRVVLGALQAGILPSCVYLISSWYKRSEMQLRITLFYSVSVFVGSFGNILALGISRIHTNSLHGWRWIFALEGLITVFLSFYGFSVVLPFPERKHSAHAPFLSRDEIQVMRQRIEMDRRDYVPDHLDNSKIRAYLTDVNLWAYALLALCANMVVYSSPFLLEASLPSETFSDAEVQLLSVPIGIAATAMSLFTGFLSNRSGWLCPFLILSFLLSTVGLSMIGFSDIRGVRFAGTFLSYSGAQVGIPMILSLQARNVRTRSKRLFAISLVASLAGLGALLSVLVFPMSTGPNYVPGTRTALALQITGMVVTILIMARLRHKNGTVEVTELGIEDSCRPNRGRLVRDRSSCDNTQVTGTPGDSYRQSRRRRFRSVEGIVGFKYMT